MHHGLQGHPALWVGSCFTDLIGARQLPGFDPTVLAEELPRRPALAWDAVGLSPFGPAEDPVLEDYGARWIGRAAARTVGYEDLTARTTQSLQARRAAASILRGLGYSGKQIAAALDVPASTARRLAASPPSSLERCVRMQVGLHDQLIPRRRR